MNAEGTFPFRFDETLTYDAAEVFLVRIDPGIARVDELLKAFYYLLWFPGYFGFNWDALYDCLRDLGWMRFRKVVIVHQNLPQLPVDDLRIYLNILRDAALYWNSDDEHELEIVFSATEKEKITKLVAN